MYPFLNMYITFNAKIQHFKRKIQVLLGLLKLAALGRAAFCVTKSAFGVKKATDTYN